MKVLYWYNSTFWTINILWNSARLQQSCGSLMNEGSKESQMTAATITHSIECYKDTNAILIQPHILDNKYSLKFRMTAAVVRESIEWRIKIILNDCRNSGALYKMLQRYKCYTRQLQKYPDTPVTLTLGLALRMCSALRRVPGRRHPLASIPLPTSPWLLILSALQQNGSAGKEIERCHPLQLIHMVYRDWQ